MRTRPAYVIVALALAASACGGSDRPVDPADPRSMAALGDSITRAFAACERGGDCPDASWATGGDGQVRSHAQRLGDLAGRTPMVHNVAVSGSRVSDLEAQARRAVDAKVDYVTVLIGANDACAPSESAMTPLPAFTQAFDRAMGTLAAGLPDARVLVVSIPDLSRLWEVGKGDTRVRETWERFGICQSMLADPTATDPAAVRRRARVRDRVAEYNRVMAGACERHPRCRSDGGAVFAHRFSLDDVSSHDYWHPSKRGQATLADVAWRSGHWG